MTTMQDLFDEHAPLALSRQRDLAEKIGGWSWNYDMDAATMVFEKSGLLGFGRETISTRCQVLGTESESSQTWLWSWANAASGFPAPLVEIAEALRARGADENIPELSAPSLPLASWDGHRIAMIASGLTPCAGYYRGPYPGGALFVLLTGPELLTPVERPLLRFSTALPEAIGGLPIHDHRLAARGLARGLDLRVTEGAVWAVSSAEGTMHCAFDARGRLSKLEGKLS